MSEFAQSLPPGKWTLENPDKHGGQLYFINAAGKRYVVPSIWYNQPATWRADWLRYCAERSDENANYWREQKLDAWAPYEVASREREAKRLRDTADEIERTGLIPGCPGMKWLDGVTVEITG